MICSRTFINSLLVCMLFVSSGCATKFHAYNRITLTGYLESPVEETSIEDPVYLVKFYVNDYTPMDRSHKFLEYRCAEFTIEQGFKYYYSIPRPQDRFMYTPAGYYFSQIALTNEIRPAWNDRTYDAGKVFQRLKPEVLVYFTKAEHRRQNRFKK